MTLLKSTEPTVVRFANTLGPRKPRTARLMRFLRNAVTAARHPSVGVDYLHWKIRRIVGWPRLVKGAFGTRLRTSTFADFRSTNGFVPRAGAVELINKLSANHPVFLDVGANFGVWTLALAAAHPKAHVYCFEPTPNTFAVLSENIALNGFRNVTPLQLAASDSEGVFSYQLTEKTSQYNRLTPFKPSAVDLDRGRFIDARTIEVKTAGLDDFCRSRRIDKIGFLKIDVEGAELSVLRGAETLLRSRAIELICIEVDPENLREMGDSLEDLASFVREKGYTFHFLQADGDLSPAVDVCSQHFIKMMVRPACEHPGRQSDPGRRNHDLHRFEYSN